MWAGLRVTATTALSDVIQKPQINQFQEVEVASDKYGFITNIYIFAKRQKSKCVVGGGGLRSVHSKQIDKIVGRKNLQ